MCNFSLEPHELYHEGLVDTEWGKKTADIRGGDYQLTKSNYRQVSNISRTLAGYKIVDHSDVVGASAVGAAPTTSWFST